MKRLQIIICAMLASASAHAYEELSQEAYFEVEDNLLKFTTLKAAGVIDQAREQVQAGCRQWATEKERIDERCACAAKEIGKLDDKTLFYLSMLAYERYLAKSKALEQGDQEGFEALKKQFEAKPLPIDELEKACP